jgi:hypothetical protein
MTQYGIQFYKKKEKWGNRLVNINIFSLYFLKSINTFSKK